MTTLTRLHGAHEAHEEAGCVVERQVEVDDIACRDAVGRQDGQRHEEPVLVDHRGFGET